MGETEKNHFGRLLFIMVMTLIVCLGLYWLPDEIFGFSIKKVDLLSDLRTKKEEVLSDSLSTEPFRLDKVNYAVNMDSLLRADSLRLRGLDSLRIVRRDSMYQAVVADMPPDTTQTRIEDFSTGHIGLRRFFSALNRIGTMNRPVRVAFLGDSFIEGDILVADFRAKMQEFFGGHGVGFVPISSNVEQYRPTINQRSKGWVTRSILSDHKYRYVLSGLLFEPNTETGTSSVSFKTVNAYPRLDKVSSLKFIYSRNTNSEIRVICNSAKDTIEALLPVGENVMQYEASGSFTDGTISLRKTKNLQALGIALEDNKGVVVDNFSLRGNSGMSLGALDKSTCLAWNNIRPYDLIVLQYGLNVASEKTHEYGWYRERMVKVIHHVRQCFPEADILLLGVSDRSHYREGSFRTMPSVKALHRAQRDAAQEARVSFWSVYGAMGGENSMVYYVKQRWASKDYTHLSFRGGREIARSLFEALLFEKDLYDEMEKTIY